jgi:predicted lipoprotein with Yx(FWY)xxD motif
MKQTWIWGALVLIVLIVVLGYFGRHKIRTMLMGSTPAPTQVSVASPTPTPTPSQILTTKTSSTASYLADSKGMALYIFDNDQQGVSNCNGACAAKWLPYTVATAPSILPANVSVIKRSDGSMQYAYKGMPLYYYSLDKQPGDTTGDGVGGVWHLVKP